MYVDIYIDGGTAVRASSPPKYPKQSKHPPPRKRRPLTCAPAVRVCVCVLARRLYRLTPLPLPPCDIIAGGKCTCESDLLAIRAYECPGTLQIQPHRPWISIAVGVCRAAVTSAVATCKNATATTRIAEPYRDSRLDPDAKHRLRPAVAWSARRRGEGGRD